MVRLHANLVLKDALNEPLLIGHLGGLAVGVPVVLIDQGLCLLWGGRLYSFRRTAAQDAVKVGAAAGALARCLRATGGKPSFCRLPLLPGESKMGLDDLCVANGSEALDAALADTGPQPVLPSLRRADCVAPAGQWLGEAQPIPSPAEAPLVLLQAPMGCGKTNAIRAAAAPFLGDGTPLLIASHRKALGQALAERLGVAWMPRRRSDERLQGAGFCFDSCLPQ